MWPIGLSSILALAVFFERMYSLRNPLLIPDRFLVEFFELLKQKRHLDAITICKSSKSVMGNVFLVAVENRDLSREDLKVRIEEVGKQEIAALERNTIVLGIVASVAPLLGLLGTVWGMIDAFRVIEALGEPNISNLAEGIYKALITTLAGLTVGIPSLIGHRWVLRKVDVVALSLEKESLRAINLLKAEN